MPRDRDVQTPYRLFDALARIHEYDDLEPLLDFVATTLADATDWSTVLVTFYLGGEAAFGAVGVPADTKERFREAFLQTTPEVRQRKREAILAYRRAGTNVCFIPSGEGPRPASAYLPSPSTSGSWRADDRLLILLRDWQDEVIGTLSLDNPRTGERPDEEEFLRLEEIDRFASIVARIAENRFWAVRLEQSERAYRGIFNATTDGMFILDADGRIVEANAAACQLHGYTYDEMLALTVLDTVPADDATKLEAARDRILDGEEVVTSGTSLRKDGSTFENEVRAVAFRFHGAPCVLAVLQDVTERNRLLQHLLAEQRDESIVAMAGGVAHDFSNLLMGITGSVSLLRAETSASPEARRQCDRIAATAEGLSRLTGQLLAIARGIRSEPQALSLAEIVTESRPLLEGIIESRHDLVVEIAEDLWTLHADRVQLDQILLNLVQNACEAMDRGGHLRIEALNMRRDTEWWCERTGAHPAGDYVRLRVTDDGPGMSPDVRDHACEPYFSSKPEGSGLGLAAVQGIVRRHRGALHIDSTPGAGTCIDILLPRSTAQPARRARAPEPEKPKERSRRVLLVEDDPLVREVATDMLEAIGCSVLPAENGARAIEVYQDAGPLIDLVLLDVTMPGMTGVEAHEALRAMDPDVRVLFASGHMESVVREHLEGGPQAAGFIQKPYTLRALERALHAALDEGLTHP